MLFVDTDVAGECEKETLAPFYRAISAGDVFIQHSEARLHMVDKGHNVIYVGNNFYLPIMFDLTLEG